MERIAAGMPAGTDPADVRRAAGSFADAVAGDALAQAMATADAATTVAAAVSTAAERTALAASTAATIAFDRSVAAADAGTEVVHASGRTSEATSLVVAANRRLADLAVRAQLVAALRDSERRFSLSFEHATAGMALVSLTPHARGRVLRVNPALRGMTGRSEQALLALSWQELVHEEEREEQEEAIAGLLDGVTSSYEGEARWVDAVGRELWVRARLHTVRDTDDPPVYAVGQFEDLTGQRRAESALRAREERFRLAFEHAHIGMMFLSLDGSVRRANQALYDFLGRGGQEVVGRRLEMLADPVERAAVRAAVEDLVAGTTDASQAEYRFERPDGSHVWGALGGSLVADEQGRPAYLVFQLRDVTERRSAEALLAHQALHDELTGLPNRVLIHEQLLQARSRAVRAGTGLAVLFVDLDDFKEVNDSLGHLAGDAVLVEVADRLRHCLRESDTAGRLGGDEFVVVVGDAISDPDEARVVADRIEAALSEPFTVAGSQIRVTASIGITVDDGSAQPHELLNYADVAMYRAKTQGKNRYEVYHPVMRAEALRHLNLAGQLDDALTRSELRLHYQPIYAVTTGAVTGVEALLRWEHPTRGLLGPADFLDVAEGRRMMVPIGEWVCREAIGQAGRWQREFGDRAPDMWVNVSGQQLGRRHLPELLARCLAEAGVEPSRLGLEVTERQLVGHGDDAGADLRAVHELGVRLAVDDFGTGYASFDYLRRFDVDEIKIDRSFVSGLGRDPTDTAVTNSIVALGRSLDLAVVAEGVETGQQYDALRALGCDSVQGYLFHRPAAADVIERLLRAPSPPKP